MEERKAVTAATRSRYQRASKKEKGKILKEFVALTGIASAPAPPSIVKPSEKICPRLSVAFGFENQHCFHLHSKNSQRRARLQQLTTSFKH